jgi:hypothetical protein
MLLKCSNSRKCPREQKCNRSLFVSCCLQSRWRAPPFAVMEQRLHICMYVCVCVCMYIYIYSSPQLYVQCDDVSCGWGRSHEKRHCAAGKQLNI